MVNVILSNRSNIMNALRSTKHTLKELGFQIEENTLIFKGHHIPETIKIDLEKTRYLCPAVVIQNLIFEAFIIGYELGVDDVQTNLKKSIGVYNYEN